MKAIRKIECHHVLDGPVDASFSYSPGYLDLAYRYIPTNKEPEQQPNIFQTLFLFGGSQKKCIHSFVFRKFQKTCTNLVVCQPWLRERNPAILQAFTQWVSQHQCPVRRPWPSRTVEQWLVYHGWFLRSIVHSFGPVLPQLFRRSLFLRGSRKRSPNICYSRIIFKNVTEPKVPCRRPSRSSIVHLGLGSPTYSRIQAAKRCRHRGPKDLPKNVTDPLPLLASNTAMTGKAYAVYKNLTFSWKNSMRAKANGSAIATKRMISPQLVGLGISMSIPSAISYSP